MNLIGTFFAWLIPAVTTWAINFFTRKIRTVVTTVAGFVLLTGAFVVCITKLIAICTAFLTISPFMAFALGIFLPYNFKIVLSSIMSAKSCRWAYDKAIEKLKMVNSAT